jgi:hypothetical protein
VLTVVRYDGTRIAGREERAIGLGAQRRSNLTGSTRDIGPMRGSVAGELWKDEPEGQDFRAAESYLSLQVGPAAAAKLVKALRKEQTLQSTNEELETTNEELQVVVAVA